MLLEKVGGENELIMGFWCAGRAMVVPCCQNGNGLP